MTVLPTRETSWIVSGAPSVSSAPSSSTAERTARARSRRASPRVARSSRLMTSAPQAPCGFPFAAFARTSPVTRSTSEAARFVVPTSTARPTGRPGPTTLVPSRRRQSLPDETKTGSAIGTTARVPSCPRATHAAAVRAGT